MVKLIKFNLNNNKRSHAFNRLINIYKRWMASLKLKERRKLFNNFFYRGNL